MRELVQKTADSEQTKIVYKRVTTAEAKTVTTISQALATFRSFDTQAALYQVETPVEFQQSNYDGQPPNFPFTHFSILLTIFVCSWMREKKTIRRIEHGIILS